MRKKDPSTPAAAGRIVKPALRAALRSALRGWYAAHSRDLPWRATTDPYCIWLSEVMLQQTQVKSMVPYYHRFLRRFPDVHSLARAELETVLKLWEGLGYYSRARNLHRAATIVSGSMHGQFPDSKQGWLQLPGVGDYIASAVSSIVHGRCHAVVDGNVKRVLARLFCLDRPVNQPSSHKVFQGIATQLLDHHRPGDHNQAVMELGALVCSPRTPRCSSCPLADDCCALKRGQVAAYPKTLKRAALPERQLAVGVVFKKGKILMVRRPVDGFLGGLWELPGGPIDPGIDPSRACVLGIGAVSNITASVERHLVTVRHTYTHFKLRMEVFLCRWVSGRIYLRGPQAFKWMRASAIGDLPLHGAVHKAMSALP
jgi:A/G-specific adenine glycosylase